MGLSGAWSPAWRAAKEPRSIKLPDGAVRRASCQRLNRGNHWVVPHTNQMSVVVKARSPNQNGLSPCEAGI